MNIWKRWIWPGLFVTAALTAFAVWSMQHVIQTDLETRFNAAVEAQGIDWAAIRIDGRDGFVSGIAPDEAGAEALQSLAATVDGLRLQAVETDLLPLASPYEFSLSREANRVTAAGHAPYVLRGGGLASLLAKAIPTLKVIDKTTVARGAPSEFREYALFAAAVVERLSAGAVFITGNDISVSGQVVNGSTYAELQAFLSTALPAGLTITGTEISAPATAPFVFSVRKEGARLSLEGMVPTEEFRDNLKNFLTSVSPGSLVDDEAVLQSPAPEVFELYVLATLGLLDGLSTGVAAFEGNAFTMSGKAKTPSDFETIRTALAQISEITGEISPSEVVGDYEWSAVRNENSVIISGSVPSVEVRENLMAHAGRLFSDFDVVQKLVVESGAPEGFAQQAIQVLEWLTYLENGEVSLLNGRLALSGAAKSVSAFEGLSKILGEQGARVDSALTPAIVSPYTWSVARSNNGSVLSGLVPDQMAGEANEAAARSVLGGEVQSEQKIAMGAPEEFANATAAILGAVGQLDSSGASMRDRAVNIYGEASNKARAERIYGRLEADLSELSFTLDGSISYPSLSLEPTEPVDDKAEAPRAAPVVNTLQVAQCQSRLNEVRAGKDIRFATSKAVIKRASYPVLDALAGVLKECGVVRLEIGGHTDNRGSPRYNQGLSEARAVSVRRYFEHEGVNVSAISVYGYGESAPRASNNTHAGRSANRRIEFKFTD